MHSSNGERPGRTDIEKPEAGEPFGYLNKQVVVLTGPSDDKISDVDSVLLE